MYTQKLTVFPTNIYKMPSVKPSKNNKYPGINLMKETQDLYIKKKQQETPIKYCGNFKEKLNK